MNVLVLAAEAANGNGESTDRLWHVLETYGVPAVTVIIIILVALVVAAWVSRIVRLSCEKGRLDATLSRFFSRMARWVILLIAVMFCLGRFGIDIAGFAVILGAAGLAIGLALQGTLGNIASGVMLLIFRPFKVDDIVTVAGETGKVSEIDLFTTVMDTPDNRRIIIPNGAIFGSTIMNITHHDTRRVDVAVGVEYSADIEKTRQVLEQAATALEGKLDDPPPAVVLGDLGDSSVNWQVRVWANTSDYWPMKQALTQAVKAALDNAGIGIPFPQMDVHVDGVGSATGA